MQPSPAMPWARIRSRCWLPPQPWTNSTPGTRLRGVRKWPSRDSSSTSMRIVSLLAVIGFRHCVLEEETDLIVFPSKNDRCVGRQRLILEALEGRRSEEHTSELQSRENLVCRLLLEKKNATQ